MSCVLTRLRIETKSYKIANMYYRDGENPSWKGYNTRYFIVLKTSPPRITTSPRPAAHHSSADDPAPDKPNLLPHCVPLNWSIHRPRLTDQSPAVRIGPYKYRISERNQFFVERSSWQARELRASRWTALNYTSRHLPKPADRRSIGYLIHILCGWARAACIALNIGLRRGSAIAGVFIYGINLNSFLREGRWGKVR